MLLLSGLKTYYWQCTPREKIERCKKWSILDYIFYVQSYGERPTNDVLSFLLGLDPVSCTGDLACSRKLFTYERTHLDQQVVEIIQEEALTKLAEPSTIYYKRNQRVIWSFIYMDYAKHGNSIKVSCKQYATADEAHCRRLLQNKIKKLNKNIKWFPKFS